MDKLTDGDIAELLRRYPLPSGINDAVFNREELAEALNTSTKTVTAWLNAGMPALQVGSNGKPYELSLAQCFAWSEARRRGEEARTISNRETIAAMRLELVGGSNGNGIEALDPKQRRDILLAQLAHEQLETSRNNLLRRDDVRGAFEAILVAVRGAMENAPDRVERADPTISPKAVSTFVEICDGVVDDVARRIEQYVAERPVRDPVPLKRDLFDV